MPTFLPPWSAVSQRRDMAQSLAALYASGATLAIASLTLPHWAGVNRAGVFATGVLGYPAAAVLLWSRARLAEWAFHALLAVGTVIVSVGAYFAGGGAATATTGVLYVWVALYAFYFFSWPAAAAHAGLAAVSYAVVLGALGDHAGPAQWAFTIGTVLVAGLVVGSLSRQIRTLAATDSLTGLPNRRTLEDALGRELARAGRRDSPVCVVIIDLDDFKALNDRHGHQAGDRLLKELTAQWTGALRSGDVLARYGGDEFAVLLPDCPPNQAHDIIGRLRTSADASFSAGVAQWDGKEPPASVVGRADAALLEAKRAGRNRTVDAPV